MIVCVPVSGDQVAGGWGKAARVAVARVADEAITDWQEHEVRWDVSHDEGPSGAHHARIVRFLREHDVDVAVTGHMGDPMQNTLGKLGVRVVLDASGAAREAVLAAAQG